VYGVAGYADRKSLVVLQSELSGGMVRIASDIAAKYENLAVQIRRKNVWGELKIAWNAAFEPGLLLDPVPADPQQDTDRDGVADRKDGWPEDSDFAPPRAPRPGYAVLPLPGEVEWIAVNQKGSVAGNSQQGAEFWKNGRRSLIRANAEVIAMNDRDQVLLQYEREAAASEYNAYVANAVALNPEGADQGGMEWYPASYATARSGEDIGIGSPRVRVAGVWSPEKGLVELSAVREVAQGGRWPRWTNGSRLFTINGRWIDNHGVVYGEARVALLLNEGSLDPIGAQALPLGGTDADQGQVLFQPWYEQPRWMRGGARNKWSLQTAGFVLPLNPSGAGIAPPDGRWYQSISSNGQELVGCWEPGAGAVHFELNGERIDADGFFTEVHNPLVEGGKPILVESAGGWSEALWVHSAKGWVPKPVGFGGACWAPLGSLVSRIQREDAIVPKNRRLEVRALTDSGIGLGTALHLTEEGEMEQPPVSEQALFLPIAPSAPEIYMFSGHDRDLLKLSAAAGSELRCEWRLQDAGPAMGEFAAGESDAWGHSAVGTTARFRAGGPGSPNIAGHSRSQTPGRNRIELWVEGVRVLEKPLEMVEIKPRAFWKAEPAKVEKLEGMAAPDSVTLHHTANNNFGAEEVLKIQKHHTAWSWYFIGGRSWGDIGYHFLLDPSDPDPNAPVTLYEGRQLEGLGRPGGAWTKASAVLMRNTIAGINIAMLGNYHTMEETFTVVRAKRAEKVLTALFLRYGLSGEMLRTHRGVASMPPVLEPTVCPGWQVITYLTPEGMRKTLRENLE
jgi:hypothetical protein